MRGTLRAPCSTKKSRPPNIIINYCHDNVSQRNYLRYATGIPRERRGEREVEEKEEGKKNASSSLVER